MKNDMGEMKVYRYLIYGDILETDIEMPQLFKADKAALEGYGVSAAFDDSNKIIVRRGIEEPDILQAAGERFIGGDAKRAWFRNSTGIFCIAEGKYINYEPFDGCNEKYLCSYLLGFCLSLLYWQRGDVAVHCGAVGNGTGAILITGESGSGKSTLVTRFLDKGYSLVADDIAVIKCDGNGTNVYPAFPMQKLCRDAAVKQGFALETLEYINEAKDKFAVPRTDGFSPCPRRLAALIYLMPAGVSSVRLTEVMGGDKLKLLLDSFFIKKFLPYMEPVSDMMLKYIRIASDTPMYVLLRPSEGDSTQEQLRLIEECLATEKKQAYT